MITKSILVVTGLLSLLGLSSQLAIAEPDHLTAPIIVEYSTTDAPVSLRGRDWKASIQAGVQQWVGQGAPIEYAWADNTIDFASFCVLGSTDGKNTYGWHPLPFGILGRACRFGSSARYGECDIVFSTNVDWDYKDLQSVAAHETGHCLGLGHSDDPTAVMFGVMNDIKHSVRLDDLILLCGLYECAEQPINHLVIVPQLARN